MAEIKGTNIASPVTPFTTDDKYPTHYALYGKGGYKTVQTIAERDAIPTERLDVGSKVYIASEEKEYVRQANNTWKEVVNTNIRGQIGYSENTWTTAMCEMSSTPGTRGLIENIPLADSNKYSIGDIVSWKYKPKDSESVFYITYRITEITPDQETDTTILRGITLSGFRDDSQVLKDSIQDITLFKFPNATIFGQPTIQQGQISNFSATNYLQFPFIVDFKGRAFEINMCFTTDNTIVNKQLLMDSNFGLAFGYKNGFFMVSLSSNGTAWDIANEQQGANLLMSNTTYHVKLSWDGSGLYTVKYTESHEGEYITDMEIESSDSLFPRQIVIGKSTSDTNIWSGSINFNHCNLFISGHLVWQGMDDAGLATRAAVDLSNLDQSGITKIETILDSSLVNKKLMSNPSFTQTATGVLNLQYNEGGTTSEKTVSIPTATEFANGAMSYTDKLNLDNSFSNVEVSGLNKIIFSHNDSTKDDLEVTLPMATSIHGNEGWSYTGGILSTEDFSELKENVITTNGLVDRVFTDANSLANDVARLNSIGIASESASGYMSTDMYRKLNGIEVNAQVNPPIVGTGGSTNPGLMGYEMYQDLLTAKQKADNAATSSQLASVISLIPSSAHHNIPGTVKTSYFINDLEHLPSGIGSNSLNIGLVSANDPQIVVDFTPYLDKDPNVFRYTTTDNTGLVKYAYRIEDLDNNEIHKIHTIKNSGSMRGYLWTTGVNPGAQYYKKEYASLDKLFNLINNQHYTIDGSLDYKFTSLNTIDFLDCSEAKSMYAMFNNSSTSATTGLQRINQILNSHNCIRFGSCFADCPALQYVAGLDVSGVCSESIDYPDGWGTGLHPIMNLFQNCPRISNLPILRGLNISLDEGNANLTGISQNSPSETELYNFMNNLGTARYRLRTNGSWSGNRGVIQFSNTTFTKISSLKSGSSQFASLLSYVCTKKMWAFTNQSKSTYIYS